MFDNLTYRQVRTILSQYNTEGHSPLKVLADDLNPYVLKFPKNSFDKASIIKEFLCYYLLKCWSITIPDITALSVPGNLLKECTFISNRDKRLIEGTVCFGSKLIPDAIELMDFLAAQNAPAQKRILNPEDMLKIALFDLWIENEDRRPTNNNIILGTQNKGLLIYPIDHAFTFSTLNFSELTHSSVNFSDNDSILHSPLAISIIKKTGFKADFRTELEEMFYLCIENSEHFFSQIVSNIPEYLEFTDEDKLNNIISCLARREIFWFGRNFII